MPSDFWCKLWGLEGGYTYSRHLVDKATELVLSLVVWNQSLDRQRREAGTPMSKAFLGAAVDSLPYIGLALV